MMIYSTGMRVVREVAAQGGFSKAAAKLGVSGAAVSKQVKSIEQNLGLVLFHRTTRTVRLTEAGGRLVEALNRSNEEFSDLLEQLSEGQDRPSGRLRVSAPMAFGEKFLVSPIAEYASLYPEVMVDIEFNDKRVNLIEEDYDLVIRIGSLDDSGLIAKKLCDLSLYLCASPKFIEEHGIPAEPADLRALPFVCYRDSSTGFNLSYKSPNGIQRSLSTKPVIYANSLEMLVESSLRGLGYAQLPSFAIRRHLENGDLIQLLSNYACLPEISMYALYADRRFLPLKVRKLIDLLSTHFQST